MLDELTSLFNLLRYEAATNVEWSFDSRPDAHGCMIPLNAFSSEQVERVAAFLPSAGTWCMATRRLVAAIVPDAMLLRLTRIRNELDDLTVYLRFPDEAAGRDIEDIVSSACLLRTRAALLDSFAKELKMAGARGIGLRVDAGGKMRLAVYFHVHQPISRFGPNLVRNLLTLCGWPEVRHEEIESDLRPLYLGGSLGVVGIDLNESGDVEALKFDPANVPLSVAAKLIAAKKSDAWCMETLYLMARTMRALSVSYLGVKYGQNGFQGWRLYFSSQPSRLAAPGRMHLNVRSQRESLSRMPHY
jgi:hypothetical protein